MAVDRIGDGLALRSKGDIVSYDGTANIAVNVGTNGQILTAQSSTSSGLEWVTPPVSETQYMEIIGSTYLTAAVSSVSFSSIPSTYKDLYLRWAVKNTGNSDTHISFNGTTSGSNHESVSLFTTSSIQSDADSQSYVLIHSTYVTSNDSNQSHAPGHMTIYQYANTSYHKNASSHGGYRQSTHPYVRTNTICFASTSAINRIDFKPGGAGDIAIGSHFVLYGIKE
jgi:hypothetical protein